MNIKEKRVGLKDGHEILLKAVTPAMANAFLEHLIISSDESYQNLNRGSEFWKKVTTSEEEKILSNMESMHNGFMMGAFYQDRIIGGLGLFGMNQEFALHNASLGMSIQKAFWGLGLGTQMIEHALIEAKDIGLHRIELSVRTYNQSGIRLYEKMGFERIGLLKDAAFIDGKFVNEYSYQKIL